MGTVTDPSGRGVPRAEVRVEDSLRGVVRTAQTDAAGFFRIVDLSPASYTVTTVAAGFRDARRNNITVAVATTVRVDVQLSLAGITQTVDVPETAPMLQTASGDLGTVLDRARIESFPLNRRDFLQLTLLIPGVQGPVEGSELSTRGAFAMHANGGREEFNNFLLDGADNNDPYVNRYVVQPSVDSVEEFKVGTSSYSAEFGRSGAGQVNVVTRRGTNRFDGSIYEYFRDRALDARNFFDEGTKPPFSRHQFGAALGGPIARNRTFLFGTLDVLRERQGLSRLGNVPSAAERGGDLSRLGVPVTDPFTTQPFAGGIIPSSRIAPLSRQVLAMFPAANRSVAGANFLGQPTARDNETQVNIRIDHQLSRASQLMVRYSAGRVDLAEPYTEGTGVTAGYGDVVDDRTWNLTAQHTHVFEARAVNAFRFGANGFSRDLLTENHATDVGAAWNVGWLKVPAPSFGYPVINVAGYSRVGDAFGLPILRDTATYQFADDLTIDRGPHLFKVGGEMRHIRLNSKVDLFSRGQLSFTGAFTGTGIGDLLLGFPTFGLQAQSDNPIAMRTNAFSAYAQDDWRVRPNVTLNLGVRYEYVTPAVDARNGMSTLNLASGKIVQAGTNGVSRSGIRPDRNNVAPRLGVSWRVNEATVVRAGYGLFYDSGMLTVNTAQYFNPPQFNLRVFVPGPQGLLTLDNPFPLSSGFAPPATLSILSPDLQAASMQHWNVAAQREMASIGSVTLAYAGSRGSNLVRPRDLNQPAPAPGDVQARRPFPAYSDIFLVESAGRSTFHSFQALVNRPLTRGVSIWGAYTLSKSMDDASSFLGTPADTNFPQDSQHPEAERAPSAFDVRHRLALAAVVELPRGNPWTRDVQVHAIAVLHTGQPFTPILRFDNSNTGNTGGSTAGSDRPNLVGNPVLANPTADAWFNTGAFSIPAPRTFGSAGRNSVRGPGFASFDVGLSRRIPVSGGRALTLGLQAFNLFNRTNFNLPEHFVDEPSTFGRVFSAKAARQLQLMARLKF